MNTRYYPPDPDEPEALDCGLLAGTFAKRRKHIRRSQTNQLSRDSMRCLSYSVKLFFEIFWNPATVFHSKLVMTPAASTSGEPRRRSDYKCARAAKTSHTMP